MLPKMGSHNINEFAMPLVEIIDEKIDRPSHDLPNPVNLILISGLEPQPLGGQPQTQMHKSIIPPASTFGPHLVVPVPSQNASPTSLEACFFKRKQRGISGDGVTLRAVEGKGVQEEPAESC